ncbi:MAG: gliding motility-associated C-terminal domain-containing protein [Paludibacter sp.]|nr:gliding motility-associated C-terminal domain-containing protein [Paludibacter sp.]
MKKLNHLLKDTITYGKYFLLFLLLVVENTHLGALTITENLRGTSSPNFIFGGDAYLTAAAKEDTDGEGWLRLTQDSTWQTGYALLKQAFPSKLGLIIDFEFMIWHTNPAAGGADGICVFLYDANTPVFNIGAFGGSLGYAQRKTGTREIPGVSNGFLGLGIDELGNYSNPTEGRVNGPGHIANCIGLRGPESADYVWLTGSGKLPYDLQIGGFATRPNDASNYRQMQIEISPTSNGGSGNQYTVTARIKTSSTGNFQTVFGPYTLPYDAPDSLKLGFAASTGANFNKHDVRNLLITTSTGVRVKKSVDKSLVRVGDSLTYTLDMLNQGDEDITGLKLSDVFSMPSCFQITSITFDNQGNTANTATGYSASDLSNIAVSLAAYGNSQLIIKGKVIDYPSNGVITNTATLDLGTSGVTDTDITNNVSSVSTFVLNDDEKISLVKTVSNSTDFQLGDVVKYNFTVSNPGEVSLSNVELTDNKLSPAPVYVSGDMKSDNILEPGESWLYTGNYTVTQADIDSGKIVNQAIVTSLDPNNVAVTDTSGTSATNNDPTVVLLNNNSKITLVKTVSSSGAYSLGSTIRYLFSVSNTGNTVLSNISITDNKLSSVVYQSGDINLNGKLDVGETWLYTGEYIVTQTDIDTGEVTNSATVTAKDSKNNDVTDISGTSASNDEPTVTPINPTSKIALTKVISNSGPFKSGDEIKYSLTVSNTGNTDLSDISITDKRLPNPVIYINGDVNNDNLLNVPETWTYSGNYIVTQADVDSGFVSNIATVTAKDPSSNTVQDISGPTIYEDAPTKTILPQHPEIALIKTVSNSGTFRLGDIIRYDFTVANTGNVTLQIDSLSDTKLLKTNIAFVSGDVNANDLLDVGEIWVYSGSYQVIQADVDSGQVVNSAVVYALDPSNATVTDISGSTTINDYPTVTPVAQNGKIALVKSVTSTGSYVLGSTVSYNFSVTNTGSVTLSDVSVTDSNLSGDITKVTDDANGKLDIGETWSYTGTYTVTQADIDAGYILNSATVTAKDPQDKDVNDISGSAINNDNPTVTIVFQAGRIALVKEATNDGPFKLGSEIEYTFTVENTGTVTLTEPVINDSRLSQAPEYQNGDLNTDNKLGVDESWIYVGRYTVTQADVNAGTITNSAIVVAYDTQGNLVKDISGTTVANDSATVTSVNQSPIANPDSVTTKMDIPVLISILDNDVPGSTSLNTDSIQIISQPQHGTVIVQPDGTVLYTPDENYVGTDQFTYTVKDINGNVSNVTTVDITILDNQLFIPNVFTPNGDGTNEFFEIKGIDSYSNAELLIYNRWGSEVYHSTSYQNDWDGNGLNEGTYYYLLKLKKGDKITAYKGWVLLKR